MVPKVNRELSAIGLSCNELLSVRQYALKRSKQYIHRLGVHGIGPAHTTIKFCCF